MSARRDGFLVCLHHLVSWAWGFFIGLYFFDLVSPRLPVRLSVFVFVGSMGMLVCWWLVDLLRSDVQRGGYR